MTMKLPVNSFGDWQWRVRKVTFNNAVETVLGYTLEKDELVRWDTFHVFVQTAESGKTLDVGLLYSENSNGGDANGFLAAVPLTTAGRVFPAQTLTQGTNAHYISANTLGAYFNKGSDGANVAEQNAIFIGNHYRALGLQKTMSYTCSSGSAAFIGFVCFQTLKLPDLTLFQLRG